MANNASTTNVSYTRDITPFLWPTNPDDSENRYAKGKNMNNDELANKNT